MPPGAGGIVERVGERLRAGRPILTWIYTSAILFPIVFAFVAAAILTLRGDGGGGAGMERFFALFYLALMVTLASVPRSILPILLIWLALARFRPAWDAHRGFRYGGLFLLMLAAVLVHSLAYARAFNLPWLLLGWLSLSLPRLALPMLRGGLGRPAA